MFFSFGLDCESLADRPHRSLGIWVFVGDVLKNLLDFCYFAIVGSLRQALYLRACNINFFGKLIVNNLTRQLLVQLPTGFKKVERENPFNLFTKKGIT
jgi:hypothetical protein